MYIQSIIIQGYGPIQDLSLYFTATENIQPTVIFGLHGTGKSFLLNKLYQFLQKHHKEFYNSVMDENPIGINEQRVECISRANINIESPAFKIEINYTNENGILRQYQEVFPPESISSNVTSLASSRKRSRTALGHPYTNINVGIESHRRSHEERIYLYFPSNRALHSPWGYLHTDEFITSNYPLNGASQKKIIQDNFYGEIVVWLQHLIFQKYLLPATNGDDLVVSACLEDLENLLNDLLKKKWANYKASLFFDSKDRRIFITLKERRIPENIKTIPLELLSESELMVFLMWASILKRCEENKILPQDIKGIVLIDNVEQNLDISAQMVYLPMLIKRFSRIQFIVSTSSLYFLHGIKAQFEQNFQLKQLSEQEPKLDLDKIHDDAFFETLLKMAKEKIDKGKEEEESEIDGMDVVTPVDLSNPQVIYSPDATKESNTSSSSSSSSNSSPDAEVTPLLETTESCPLLLSVEIAENEHPPFPKGLFWKINSPFSVIAGRNGIGKTQLLKYIAAYLTNLNRGFGITEMLKKGGCHFSTTPVQSIQVLYYGCFKENHISADHNQRLQNYNNSSDQKAQSFYTFYYLSITNGNVAEELSQLELPEQEQYKKTVALFNLKKPDFKKHKNPMRETEEFFKICALKTIGVPIFLLAYPEVFIQHVLLVMLPGEIDTLNTMLRDKGFKYILKVKKNISRHDLNKADYFKLVTEKSSDEIAFHSLSPGEQLELMTLTWLFNINFTHEKKAILLLDEPDAHLHPSLTHQVIREIKNRIVDVYGIQVIMTTHNPVTISMPEVENHLFLMTDDNAERRIELNQARRRDINQYLMPYLISINPSFKLVFVEADNDIKFYNLMYQKILTPTSNLTAPLFFTAHGRPNTIGTAKKESKNELDEKIFEEKGEASSRGLVIRLVKKCVPESEDDTTLKDFMYGIVDNDNQDISTLPDNVYSPQRYNIENYICDPLNVFFNLLERDPENNYTLKLISEIFKVKKESSQEEEILWTREIYLDVNRETKKLKYSVLSLDGNRIDGDLNIESEILPSTEDFVKKFKCFLKDKEDEILNELFSKNLIHRHFKEISLFVMEDSQATLEKDDPTFCFPKSFYEFSLLSQNQKTVIAQKIIDEMAKLFYYKLETYPDNTYRFMIKNPRFRSKLIENKSQNLNKTPMPVYFLSEMELHYPKIFLHMQGHYLEKLYIQFFGMFAGKASILEFMKKNDVLIPQEFHQIFLGISNDGYSFTLQRTEYLKKIEEKEAILRQWPLVLRKNENQAKEIDSFKKIQAKHKEQIEKLKKENKELKMAAAHSNIATANSSDPTFFGRIPPLSLISNTPPLQQGGNLTNHN